MGGTAVGTGLNADVAYMKKDVSNINYVTGLNMEQI